MDGRPAHVLLHVEHAALGLDVEAAGIEAYALADQRDLRRGRVAPAQIDEPRSASGGAADRMDQRKVLREEIVTDNRAQGCAVTRGKRTRSLFELGRAHVIGRRVDEVARKIDALDNATEILAIHVAGQLQLQLLAVLLAIAGEAIAAQGKSQAPQAWDRAGHWQSGRRRRAARRTEPLGGSKSFFGSSSSSSANSTPARAPAEEGRRR